ncbi:MULTISPECIES: haloacid dehalogenase-like hydrolase [unclassified Streptomyces]|uniref:HAD family hydrolase n=1 Tax=unclassified Streptomyces TaxID=2593676 RepID=UPI0033FB3EF2
MRLVLWDIDHTLIDTRGVGRELSAAAFEEATGVVMREQAKIDGITERVIFRETAKLHGIDVDGDDRAFDRFAEALAGQHVTRAADLRERGHALPGAAAALDALAAAGVVQTVVSGNVRRAAEIKLAVFGLDRHIRWEAGAYGEDGEERADLVQLALERSGAHAGDAILIGDTPADVAGAHAHSVLAVAVASGKSSEGELRASGADVVLPDLRDVAPLLAAVEGRVG